MNPPSNLSPSIRSYLFVHYIERPRRLFFFFSFKDVYLIASLSRSRLSLPSFLSLCLSVSFESFPFSFFLFSVRGRRGAEGRRQVHIDGRRITLRSSFFFKLSSSGLRKEGELIYERILRQFAARERGFFFWHPWIRRLGDDDELILIFNLVTFFGKLWRNMNT